MLEMVILVKVCKLNCGDVEPLLLMAVTLKKTLRWFLLKIILLNKPSLLLRPPITTFLKSIGDICINSNVKKDNRIVISHLSPVFAQLD